MRSHSQIAADIVRAVDMSNDLFRGRTKEDILDWPDAGDRLRIAILRALDEAVKNATHID